MIDERISYLSRIFDYLMATNSRLEKEQLVKNISSEYKEDFNYILECLAGEHIFGYTLYKTNKIISTSKFSNTDTSVKDILLFLQLPRMQKDLSHDNIEFYIQHIQPWYDFFEPIVNRTLRLGIGKSILPKSGLAPMLAKKFEGQIAQDIEGYYVTEKLDGNRCIAHFDGIRWIFTSRNGKQMHVNFNMDGLPTNYVYDGEVLSVEQTANSMLIANGLFKETTISLFNATSSMINRHSLDKKLVYNIFDIMVDDVKYHERRRELANISNKISCIQNDVRILPTLGHYKTIDELCDKVYPLLDNVTFAGGEGLMINCGNAKYNHTRTTDLLKLKKSQRMDLKVVDFEYGNGKYTGQIGALVCEGYFENGEHVVCRVGSGLSDEQRHVWSLYPEKIIGKIVEIEYFGKSQNIRTYDSTTYSLRFPRLKKVRDDKTEVSNN